MAQVWFATRQASGLDGSEANATAVGARRDRGQRAGAGEVFAVEGERYRGRRGRKSVPVSTQELVALGLSDASLAVELRRAAGVTVPIKPGNSSASVARRKEAFDRLMTYWYEPAGS